MARATLLAAVLLPAQAFAAVKFEPSVETRAVVAYSSDQSPETRSFNELAAGIETGVDTRRIDFDLRYRYARRFGISGPLTDKARHAGSGQLRSELIRELLYLDAQGSATILNTQFGGFVDPNADDPTQQQTFSGSIQPAIRHRFGRVQVTARYSYGVFDADSRSPPLRVGRPLQAGQGFVLGASDTRNQSASLALGNAGRSDRVRWRITADWQRDRIEQLDQLYTSKRGLADVEYSLSRTIGLIANVGYEDILDRQDAIVIDATGVPVPDANGFVQRDPTMPHTINFDTSGLTYEAGVRLSPSRRTNFIARAGKRFGDFTASGSLELELVNDIRLFATYNESLNNFGRLFTTLFTDPVSGAITPIGSFAANGGGKQSPIGATTCAFGLDSDTGSCQFNLTQIASNATFKDQSAALTIAKGGAGSGEGGTPRHFSGAVSGFYTKRAYLGKQPAGLPAGTAPISLGGSTDISYGVNLRAEQRLNRQQTVGLDLRAQRNEYGLSRDGRDLQLSAQFRYDWLIARSLTLFADGFVSRRLVDDQTGAVQPGRFTLPQNTTGTASVGIRYLFAPNRGRGSQSSPRQNTPEG